jgi:hypothetical protein
MSLTRDGGKPNVKALKYSTPQGPSGQSHQGPGLGGDNHDTGQRGSSEHMSGSPGIGGTNKGNTGSQDCD